MIRLIGYWSLFLLWMVTAHAQKAPFLVILKQDSIPGLPGIQAYAFGRHDGKWLIIGGRTDGLHRRQPFASFDDEGKNKELMVVDPVAGRSWRAPLTSLPVSLQEQLSSTNMEFHQEGKTLYLVGGYGYSATFDDHKTFPGLIAVDLPNVMSAIVNGRPFEKFFRLTEDPEFAVTGGHLDKINDIWYLVGGQQFDGRYNPHGPDHGPGFFQQYTNAIRRFVMHDDGLTIRINHLVPIIDSINLHRRDLNAVPQIFPDGREGLTAFSGVFQYTADVPYLNCVNIDSSGSHVDNDFNQYYNHYHCANLPMYSASEREMHTVFFGGIAQFYDSTGVRVRNDDVPFVRTIARVTRNRAGEMSEMKMNIEMPAFLGTSAEFIPAGNIPSYPNGVIKLDELPTDTTLVGYIFGGIVSADKNVFWINTGEESEASRLVIRVFVVRPG